VRSIERESQNIQKKRTRNRVSESKRVRERERERESGSECFDESLLFNLC